MASFIVQKNWKASSREHTSFKSGVMLSAQKRCNTGNGNKDSLTCLDARMEKGAAPPGQSAAQSLGHSIPAWCWGISSCCMRRANSFAAQLGKEGDREEYGLTANVSVNATKSKSHCNTRPVATTLPWMRRKQGANCASENFCWVTPPLGTTSGVPHLLEVPWAPCLEAQSSLTDVPGLCF